MRKRRLIRQELRSCATCQQWTEHDVYESWEVGGHWPRGHQDVRAAARCTVCRFRTIEHTDD